MEFKKVEKISEGKFISRYDITYVTEDKKNKVYEMISRDKNIKTRNDLKNPHTDGVVIVMTNESEDKILLNREFRMAVGGYVYNFPAGLIDAGETPQTAARRELKEETGMDLIEVTDELFDSYSAVGFSNETNAVVIGKAGGTFAPSDSTLEEIQAGWYTKEEVRKLLKENYFAARTQAFCYMWAVK